MTNYSLQKIYEEKKDKKKESWAVSIVKILPLLRSEKKQLIITVCAVLLNAVLTLIGPFVIGYVIDTFIKGRDYHGVLVYSGILLVVAAGAFVSNYAQILVMGSVAQRTLWRLRNDVFNKIMELPLAFFNQNKAGDLISRINNDIDKLNQFFSQGLMRFVGTFFTVTGAAIFILIINWKLGIIALIPAILVFVFSWLISPWNKKRNVKNLKATGALSSEIQESMTNFKVILAFNRRDYFKKRFEEVNEGNFKAAVGAGISNELLTPVFEWSSNLGLLAVLGYGIYLITQGQFAVGLLVSFVLYVTRLYDPLREMARMWSTLQNALAGWDRIRDILELKSDLTVISSVTSSEQKNIVIEFKNVSFAYPDGDTVLKHVNFSFEKGKTYALVGPTGGGKTTTASLIARLFDPTSGTVLLDGKDIRSYEAEDRARKIGFILQEPFLFSGTVRENILYGNHEDFGVPGALEAELKNSGLSDLLEKFEKGLDTKIGTHSSLSLGQRQLIAFIRAVLRKPEILVLDEATANIDTVTEQLLGSILEKLPKGTTRVVIAHRLNTIENADGIFFVNHGEVVEAGSMEHAVDMLLHHKRTS